MSASREDQLQRFYAALYQLQECVPVKGSFASYEGTQGWPTHGVYFIFEPGEFRRSVDRTPRIVRVGTHALHDGNQSTLWTRLKQHRGTVNPYGGNHRKSVLRKLVGQALIVRGDVPLCPTWGSPRQAHSEEAEYAVEERVSKEIGRMWVVCLPISDRRDRKDIERNSLALLSNYRSRSVDTPSGQWLGTHSPDERVRKSGLWNRQHVDDVPDSDFIVRFEHLVAASKVSSHNTTSHMPSERVILERMHSLCIEGVSAVALQNRRLKSSDSADQVFPLRWWIDLQFLIVALRRLRRAAELGKSISAVSTFIVDAINEFDAVLPGLRKMRNVGEHVDAYVRDDLKRYDKSVQRGQVQVGTFDGKVFSWLDEHLDIDVALGAAEQLYARVKRAVKEYVMTIQS